VDPQGVEGVRVGGQRKGQKREKKYCGSVQRTTPNRKIRTATAARPMDTPRRIEVESWLLRANSTKDLGLTRNCESWDSGRRRANSPPASPASATTVTSWPTGRQCSSYR